MASAGKESGWATWKGQQSKGGARDLVLLWGRVKGIAGALWCAVLMYLLAQGCEVAPPVLSMTAVSLSCEPQSRGSSAAFGTAIHGAGVPVLRAAAV